MFKKRIIAACVALSVLGTSFSAYAGLNDALNSMFMSNATTAGAFSTQSRGGFEGGGGALRTPIRNINLVAFDPPRFSAGCGGIDFFGGSFSFINADQLVALFRQVAANAVGVAFKAAINAINPALAKLMEEFQSKIQSLNEMMKNTCAMANSIVKTFSDPDARKEMVDNASAAVDTAKGFFDDPLAGLSNLFGDKNGSSSRRTSDGSCDTCGNLTWKALADTSSGQYLGNPDAGESDMDTANEIVMSLVGTVVMSKKTAPADNADGTEKPEVGAEFSPVLSLFDLRDGSKATGKPLKRLYCKDGTDREECTNVGEKDMSFDGMLGYVNKMMFGQAEGLNSGVTGGIVDKLTSCSSAACGFTANEKAFINSISAPVLAILKQVQHSPGSMAMIAEKMAPVIADELAVRYGDAAMRAIMSAYSGTKITKPDVIKAAEVARRQELIVLRQQLAKQIQEINLVKTFADTVVKNNPGVMAGR